MSVQVAYTLLCFSFFAHNISKSSETEEEARFSPAVSLMFHNHTYAIKEQFGFIPSDASPEDFWGSKPVNSTSDAMELKETPLWADILA